MNPNLRDWLMTALLMLAIGGILALVLVEVWVKVHFIIKFW